MAADRQETMTIGDTLRADIKDLRIELRGEFKEVASAVNEISSRLTRLESAQDRLVSLDRELKDHVEIMTPIRDDVIAARKISGYAMSLAAGLPAVISGVLLLWHPWDKAIQDAMITRDAQLTEFKEVVTRQSYDIKATLRELEYKLGFRQPNSGGAPR